RGPAPRRRRVALAAPPPSPEGRSSRHWSPLVATSAAAAPAFIIPLWSGAGVGRPRPLRSRGQPPDRLVPGQALPLDRGADGVNEVGRYRHGFVLAPVQNGVAGPLAARDGDP